MTEAVAKLLRQSGGSRILRIPAWIKLAFPAFQDQFCTAQAGEALAAAVCPGVNFDFNTFLVSGVGGRAGKDHTILMQHDTESQAAECLIIFKLRYQVSTPGFGTAQIVKVFINQSKLTFCGQITYDLL